MANAADSRECSLPLEQSHFAMILSIAGTPNTPMTHGEFAQSLSPTPHRCQCDTKVAHPLERREWFAAGQGTQKLLVPLT